MCVCLRNWCIKKKKLIVTDVQPRGEKSNRTRYLRFNKQCAKRILYLLFLLPENAGTTRRFLTGHPYPVPTAVATDVT